MQQKIVILASALLLSCHAIGADNSVGFVETFALAEDRAKALSELIPGTEDYYFYHALYYEQQGAQDAFDKNLEQWRILHNGKTTERMRMMLHRQRLLGFATAPKETYDYLRKELNFSFHHRAVNDDPAHLGPTKLDPRQISTASFLRRGLERGFRLDPFEDEGLHLLAEHEKVDAAGRRMILSRLRHPDYPGLVDWIAADLDHKDSKGFGSLNIHTQLTHDQLQALQAKRPKLIQERAFVEELMGRMRPPAHLSPEHDIAALEEHLAASWAFVQSLEPSFNSLKLHVAHQVLKQAQATANYDAALLINYLKLPRAMPYMLRSYLEEPGNRSFPCQLDANFSNLTIWPPVGNDEALVRNFLLRILQEKTDRTPFAPYLNDRYLNEVFAEAQITQGGGDPEQWASLISPERYAAIKSRIDLAFAPQNPSVFQVDEEVNLLVDIKNVPQLRVKVFEINTFNYYREEGKPLNLAMNLDGMVASIERVIDYPEPSEQRVRRILQFPELNKRGAWIIELVGNGQRSRAMISKGRLRGIASPSAAGHRFRIVNELGEDVPTATLWMSNREYTPSKQGSILVPYSGRQQETAVILRDGDFSTLMNFTHEAEQYQLAAGIHIERESLIKHRKAPILVRPHFSVNGHRSDIRLLEDVTLTVASKTHEGIESAYDVPKFELHNDHETTTEIMVPESVASVTVTLTAKVQHLNQQKKIDLKTSRTFTLNRIDTLATFKDAFLTRDGDNYLLEVRGKNGERYPQETVHVDFKHRLFKWEHQVQLSTDEQGRTWLGPLPDITDLRIRYRDRTPRIHLTGDAISYPSVIHAKQGDAIKLAMVDGAPRCSLHAKERGQYRKNHNAAVSQQAGLLHIAPLPAGEYELALFPANTRITLRVSPGVALPGRLKEPHRLLEHITAEPLHVRSIETGEEELLIQLGGTNLLTRVHVFASRFYDENELFSALQHPSRRPPMLWRTPANRSLFSSGRAIGDEYQYILQRQQTKHFPGNMLERPGLLLNPWSRQDTEADNEEIAPGEALAEMLDRLDRNALGSGNAYGGRGQQADTGYASYDFLKNPAVVLANLVPDTTGRIRIDLKHFADKPWIKVLVTDHNQSIVREIGLPAAPALVREIRLATGFAPEKDYTRQQTFTTLKKGDKITIADAANAKLEPYTHLAQVFQYFQNSSGNQALNEFEFLTRWPRITPEEQRSLYSKYACHEVNFFLYHKDRAFFDAVIKPYLANKHHPTFMDEWLIEAPLDRYLNSWQYQRLNTLERILLAQRIANTNISRQVREQSELIQITPAQIMREYGFAGSVTTLAPEQHFARFALESAEKKSAIGLRQLRESASKSGKADLMLGAIAPDMDSDGIVVDESAAMANLESMPVSGRMIRRKSLEKARMELKGKELGFAWTDNYLSDEIEERAKVRQLFRKLETTKEWAENNYYHLPIAQQVAALVPANAFWQDYASHHVPGESFLSESFTRVNRNLTEMLLALAVLDIPFEALDHKTTTDGGSYTLEAAGPILVYHEQVMPTAKPAEKSPLLISQQLFRYDDRSEMIDGVEHQKFVDTEVLRGVIYGSQVVLTNPTALPQALNVLLQIPNGAIPVKGGFYTDNRLVNLKPFATQTIEYAFYFPEIAISTHYPANLSRDGHLLVRAEAKTLKVVDALSEVDETAWPFISQQGTEAALLTFLEQQNLHRIKLSDIAWRMQDAASYKRLIDVLRKQLIYDQTLWSYAIKHQDTQAIRELLPHTSLADQTGLFLRSELLQIDPVARHLYEHLEYHPLVNPRTHQLGAKPTILNHRLREQVQAFLHTLSFKAEVNDEDRFSVSYYLLLQGRIGEAIAWFDRVDPTKISAQLQYNYFKAYLAIHQKDLATARQIAEANQAHPVPRWRQKFAALLAQLNDQDTVVAAEDRTQTQSALAASEPRLTLSLDGQMIRMAHANLKQATLNFYPMDIELLFSRNPFIEHQSKQFSMIKPVLSRIIDLPQDQSAFSYELPARFKHANVMVEVVSAAGTENQAYFASDLPLRLIENLGRLDVDEPAVYVKVYARMHDGQVRFFKDGYTDFRGQFDYVSLNSNALDQVDRFAILVISETKGAQILEAAPPKR